ncbi:MAG: hypothetical protein ABH821_00415, partial [archaeon]
NADNKYVILEVIAKNGDIIKVNKVNGLKYSELWRAFESPKHEEHPIIDDYNKIIVVGGEEENSKRTICVIGK